MSIERARAAAAGGQHRIERVTIDPERAMIRFALTSPTDGLTMLILKGVQTFEVRSGLSDPFAFTFEPVAQGLFDVRDGEAFHCRCSSVEESSNQRDR